MDFSYLPTGCGPFHSMQLLWVQLGCKALGSFVVFAFLDAGSYMGTAVFSSSKMHSTFLTNYIHESGMQRGEFTKSLCLSTKGSPNASKKSTPLKNVCLGNFLIKD